MTLESLTRFATVEDALASTVGKEIRALLPEVVFEGDQPRVKLPGDPTLYEP